MRNIPIVLVAALVLGAVPLRGLRISHSALPPSDDHLVVAYDSPTYVGGHDWQHGSGIAIDVGQTFTLSRPVTLDRITIRLRAHTDIAGQSVSVRIGRYADAEDHSMNELLRVDSGALPRDLPVDSIRYVTLELDDSVVLDANRPFGFVVGFSGGGGVNNARGEILHMGADVYADGQAVAEFGAFTQGLAEDLVVFLHEVGGTDPPGEILTLHGNRFRAGVTWRTPLGIEGHGRAVAVTEESGCFWFFDEDNLEVFVKVLDGCSINGHYWIFMAGLTNVEVRIEVRDMKSGITRAYFNPLGQSFLPIYDTKAVAGCP